MPKCKFCKKPFTPKFNSLEQWCSPDCGYQLAMSNMAKQKRAEAKKMRKDIREAKDKLKTRSDWLKDAQKAFNEYIRERDKGLPCISCGTTKTTIQYCAGHYKTTGGHPELRFHPFNVNKQCNKNCNLHLSGNIAEYRPNLIAKIGLENVEWLEGPHDAQNWTIEEIKEIKAYYKEQTKLLKRG